MSARKPASLKRLEGGRGHRKIRTDELTGRGKPRCPEHLTDVEKALWRALVASLPPGVLTRADEQVLERMSVAWCGYREACATLRASATLVRGDHGQAVRNPMLIVRKQCAEEMQACGLQLGLSPLARCRLTNPDEPADDDPIALLLGPVGRTWDMGGQLDS